MANRVAPAPSDADNPSGSFTLAAATIGASVFADSMSARATQRPLQMPDIRLQAHPTAKTIDQSPCFWEESIYDGLGVTTPGGLEIFGGEHLDARPHLMQRPSKEVFET